MNRTNLAVLALVPLAAATAIGPAIRAQEAPPTPARSVTALAVSADGQWVVAGLASGEVKLGRIEGEGKGVVREVAKARAHEKPVVAAAFVGAGALTVASDGSTALWPLPAEGGAAGQPGALGNVGPDVASAAVSADGKLLVVGTAKGFIGAFDVTTEGKPGLAKRGQDRRCGMREVIVACSTDPGRSCAAVVTGDSSSSLSTYPLRGAGETFANAAFDVGLGSSAGSVAISPRADWALVGLGRYSKLVLASLDPAKEGRKLGVAEVEGPPTKIVAVAISSDERWALSLTEERRATLWVLHGRGTGTLARSTDLEGKVDAATFTKDGRAVVLATGEGSLSIRSIDDALGIPEGAAFRHAVGVTSAAFSPDGAAVLTGGESGEARLWRVDLKHKPEPLVELATSFQAHEHAVRKISFVGGRAAALTATFDAPAPAIASWRFADAGAVEVASFAIDQKQYQAFDAAFSPDGSRAALLYQGAWAFLKLKATPGKEPARVLFGFDKGARTVAGHVQSAIPLRTVALSADLKWALAGPWNSGPYTLWRLDAAGCFSGSLDPLGKRPLDVAVRFGEKGADPPVIALSPDARWAVTKSANGARVWKLALDKTPSATEAGRLEHGANVTALALSSDARSVVTGGDNAKARLWKLDSSGKATLAATWTGHRGPITSVAFAPGGEWAITTSLDRSGRLWRTSK